MWLNSYGRTSLYLPSTPMYLYLSNVPYCRKFSRGANFCIFVPAGECKNKNHNNFNERTLEVEDSLLLLFQDLCWSPPSASFTARWTFDAPCVSTKSKRRLSCEAMTKDYQAYGTAVLSEEIPCLRKVGNLVNFHLMWRLSRCDQLPDPAYAKIKTAKISISSKVNTVFLRNIAPTKIFLFQKQIACITSRM